MPKGKGTYGHKRGRPKKKGKLTSAKAKEILRHGSVRGHKLTAKQKRFMGARAGGKRRMA